MKHGRKAKQGQSFSARKSGFRGCKTSIERAHRSKRKNINIKQLQGAEIMGGSNLYKRRLQ